MSLVMGRFGIVTEMQSTQKQATFQSVQVSELRADCQSQCSSVRSLFVDHRQLLAIHPIDRETANQKCNERAAAALAALPIIKANGMKLSESLIASNQALGEFESVTGFQVVALADGYITFEGNGRRESLVRAFGGKDASIGIQVEVRLFVFKDEAIRTAIAQQMERVRRWKNVVDV